MEVVVTINPDGTTNIEVNGAVGAECSDVTKALTKALGGETLSDTKKPEYYEVKKESSTTKDW